MNPSVDDLAKLDAIDAKLAELDPIMEKFCARRGFRLTKIGKAVSSWPRRVMCIRGEIDGCMSLAMDLTVAETRERGFYAEMPWTLDAAASLPLEQGEPIRILRTHVLLGAPYSRLAEILEDALEHGSAILRGLTRQDVVTNGEIVGLPPLMPSDEEWENVEAVGAELAKLDPILKKFCAQAGLHFNAKLCTNRNLWRCLSDDGDIRRSICLNVDLEFTAILQRGFYPEIPLSLEAAAVLPEKQGQRTQMLRKKIFNRVPYSTLAGTLQAGLNDALFFLRSTTREDVIANGEL